MGLNRWTPGGYDSATEWGREFARLADSLSRKYMQRYVHVTDCSRTFLPSFSAARDGNIWHPDLLRFSPCDVLESDGLKGRPDVEKSPHIVCIHIASKRAMGYCVH